MAHCTPQYLFHVPVLSIHLQIYKLGLRKASRLSMHMHSLMWFRFIATSEGGLLSHLLHWWPHTWISVKQRYSTLWLVWVAIWYVEIMTVQWTQQEWWKRFNLNHHDCEKHCAGNSELKGQTFYLCSADKEVWIFITHSYEKLFYLFPQLCFS